MLTNRSSRDGVPPRWAPVVVFHIVMVAGLAIVGLVAQIPAGFAEAQVFSADRLAALGPDRLAELAEGAVGDLTVFIPGYLLVGLMALALVGVITRSLSERPGLWLPATTLALAAGFDLVETLLVRDTIQTLLDAPAAAADLDRQVLATRVLFGLKALLLVATYGLSLRHCLRRR